MNGKESFLHKVAVPNRFIRVSPAGRVSYSQRLTVTAGCRHSTLLFLQLYCLLHRMDLRKFPHDSQSCPLRIGSFGHSSSEVTYKWTETPATLGDIELSQYHMIRQQQR